MPCRDGGPSCGETTSYRLDRVTQMLCYTCGQMEDTNQLRLLSTPTRRWWREHKESDRMRVVAQMHEVAQRLVEARLHVDELTTIFIEKASAVHPVSDFHKAWMKSLATEVVEFELRRRNTKSTALNKLSTAEKRALGLE
jgi:trehalose utilization protein